MKIALSAGHTPRSDRTVVGSYDPGVCSSGYQEGEVVRIIRDDIIKKIDGIIPYVKTTSYWNTQERYYEAKRAGCDYYLSLHVNGASPSASGVESYYNGKIRDRKNVAYLWANDLVFDMVTQMNFRNRSARSASSNDRIVWAISEQDYIPAVLLECGFLTNTQDRNKIVNQHEFIADSIIATLCKYSGVPLYRLTIGSKLAYNQKTGKNEHLDVAPQIVHGNSMLPIRALAEALGAKVGWNANTKQISITLGRDVVSLQLGNQYATLNGKTVKLRVAPVEVGGRSLIPVRDVTNLLGFQILWHPATKQVDIFMRKK